METIENESGKYHRHFSIWQCMGFGILGVLGFIAFVFIGGTLIMWLWNSIASPLFHTTTINFWEAIGLAVLARLLFGGGCHGWHHGGRRWKHGMWHGRHSGNCHTQNDCGCHTNTNDKYEFSSDNDKCECGPDKEKWKFYDDYWKQEGEKAFNEFVRRKTENPEKP
jgi:hypothetical protein